MKPFKSFISEASLWDDKYPRTSEFTLNVRTPPNAVHKALTGMGYPTGTTFKKTDKTPKHVLTTTKTGKPVSVTLEDDKGIVIQLIGSKAALGTAFNKGNSKGGGKMYAADWEEVITIAHNMQVKGLQVDPAAELGEIKLPVKQKIIAKINAGIGADIIGNVKLGSSHMIHTGRKVGTPSTLWKKTFEDAGIKMNPKSMTPKTDMKTGAYNISLKQTGGSQLMSGYKGDTMGVITAAYNKAMKAREGQAELLEGLERTFGYLYNDVKDNFEKSADVVGGARDVRAKVALSGKQGTNLLTKAEAAVWETIQKGERVQEHLRQIMEQHPLVKEYAVEEAMTGNMKFSDDLAKSNYLMVFSPSGTSSLKKIDDSLVSGYASKVSWSVGIKSAQGQGALSLRAIVADEYEPTSTFKSILSEAWDEIGEDRIYLTEGWWDKVKDTAKKGLNWAKEKAMKILKMLWDKVIKKIIALLAKGYVWIRRIFGWQPQVTAISNPYF